MIRNDTRITGERDCAVDFVKGVLVELMILYHTINYFIGPQHVVLKHLDFVTGGFVFISGYVVSAFYTVKYRSNAVQMHMRLLLRGVKIVLLFTLVNLAINLVVERNYNNAELGIGKFYENVYSIYILGYKQLAAFEILLPIAYVLIISPVLFVLYRWRNLLILAISIVFLYCAFTATAPFNLLYVSIGLNGFALGLFFADNPKRRINEKYYKTLFVCLAALYSGIVSVWEQTFSLYAFGIIAILGALYLIGSDLNYDKCVWRTVVRCGQYSLDPIFRKFSFFKGCLDSVTISVPL
jgi:hypothetical protein